MVGRSWKCLEKTVKLEGKGGNYSLSYGPKLYKSKINNRIANQKSSQRRSLKNVLIWLIRCLGRMVRVSTAFCFCFCLRVVVVVIIKIGR